MWPFDKKRIWVSDFHDDDEAYDLWAKRIGVPEDRIVRLGRADNFWGPVGDTGICGPSSELYYDTGEARGCGKDTCQPGCDCDRYIEYWNLVFPQFFYTEQGVYDPLPRPGIDTGLGLERVAFILQEVEDNFHTDLFLPIRNTVESVVPSERLSDKAQVAVNVATDHVRALVFALSEGIMPSNEGRGYVLRRLLRRAVTKMHTFGVKEPFLARGVDSVVDTMGDRYPELRKRADIVREIVTAEEERFFSTIEQGMGKFNDVVERTKRNKKNQIAGRDAFVLYDTFGFPIEMTKELAEDQNLDVDENGFAEAMEEQKERARGKSFHAVEEAGDGPEFVEIAPVVETEIVGYESLECDASAALVRCFVVDEAVVVDLVTDRTVFYAESGGQVGDKGSVVFGGRSFEVLDTLKRDKHIVHRLGWGPAAGDDFQKDIETFFRASPNGRLRVDREARLSTARNHTATHLLHAALRNVLGTHVAQAGSLVEPERLRFDFQHHQSMSDTDVKAVEDEVNDAVLADIAVAKQIMPYKDAIDSGALALFGEKYADEVRMVSVGGVSKELCGGTHLDHTGEIGAFVVRQETAVAAGIRRIEALTGRGALEHFKKMVDERAGIARILKVSPDDVERRVRSIVEENEKLKKKLRAQEGRLAGGQLDDVLQGAEDIGGTALVTMTLDDGDVPALRRWGDRIREKLDVGAALLCLTAGKKPMLLIVVSDRAIKEKNLKANELAAKIGEALSLRGGGKDHMAQMGLAKAGDFDKVTSLVKDVLANLG